MKIGMKKRFLESTYSFSRITGNNAYLVQLKMGLIMAF